MKQQWPSVISRVTHSQSRCKIHFVDWSEFSEIGTINEIFNETTSECEMDLIVWKDKKWYSAIRNQNSPKFYASREKLIRCNKIT